MAPLARTTGKVKLGFVTHIVETTPAYRMQNTERRFAICDVTCDVAGSISLGQSAAGQGPSVQEIRMAKMGAFLTDAACSVGLGKKTAVRRAASLA